jgi:hypothetical protein
MNTQIVKALDEIVTKSVGKLPYVKGDQIRLGDMLVQKTKVGYTVFDISNKTKLADTYSAAGAIAIAKTKNRSSLEKIIFLDKKLGKCYCDALFFRHTLEKTKDSIRRECAGIRYDIAFDQAIACKTALEKFVYDK